MVARGMISQSTNEDKAICNYNREIVVINFHEMLGINYMTNKRIFIIFYVANVVL